MPDATPSASQLSAEFDHDLVCDTLVWSAALKALYGFARDDAASMLAVKERIPPEDAPAVAAAFARACDPSGDGRFRCEHRIATAPGRFRWLRIEGVTVFDRDNSPPRAIRSIGTVTDVTDALAARGC